MDFESYKEQLIERLKVYQNQIQESEVYIKLKERYDSLQPNVQTAIKVAAVFFTVYFFYSFPASYVTSANEKMEFFEENRELTRDLIRAGRIAKTVQLPPPAPSGPQMIDQVNSKLTLERVLDKQKGNIGPADNLASKNLVPKSIKQSGVKANLKQLTIRQVIKLGESFNQISSSKLMNIVIQANGDDPHFYSADYEIAAFDVPRDALEELSTESKNSKDKKGKGKGKSRFKSKKKSKK